MEDLEEALRNVDVFCRILVEKILEDNGSSQNVVVEPVEKLLKKKHVVKESLGSVSFDTPTA